jgi:hypothetical protein
VAPGQTEKATVRVVCVGGAQDLLLDVLELAVPTPIRLGMDVDRYCADGGRQTHHERPHRANTPCERGAAVVWLSSGLIRVSVHSLPLLGPAQFWPGSGGLQLVEMRAPGRGWRHAEAAPWRSRWAPCTGDTLLAVATAALPSLADPLRFALAAVRQLNASGTSPQCECGAAGRPACRWHSSSGGASSTAAPHLVDCRGGGGTMGHALHAALGRAG